MKRRTYNFSGTGARTDDSSPAPDDDAGSNTSTNNVHPPNRTTVTVPTQTPIIDVPQESILSPEFLQPFVNASLKETMCLFADELGHSITTSKDPKDQNLEVSDISMSFPNTQMFKIACQLTIPIAHQKAESFLGRMFGVKLEVDAGLRYVSMPGGSQILPRPHLILRGCQRDCIDTIFGEVIARAISTCPVYKEETKRYRRITHSVWAVLTPTAAEPFTVNLSLGLIEGTELCKRLFGE